MALYEKARAIEPHNPAYVLASAEILADMGKPQEALDLIESKMDQLDQAPGMHKAAAELAMLVGRADKAVEHYEIARSQQGDDVTIQESLGRAYFFAAQYDKAVLTLADLLKQDHYARCTWVYSMLGESYLALGRPREARDNFEKTTELEKNEPRNWVNLAKAALAAKDTRRAVVAAKEAISLRPDQPESAMLLGYALMAEGDAKSANSVLSTAVRTNPDQAMLTCLLGCSYAVLGDQNLAREWYQKTLKLDPQNQIAQAMLKRP